MDAVHRLQRQVARHEANLDQRVGRVGTTEFQSFRATDANGAARSWSRTASHARPSANVGAMRGNIARRHRVAHDLGEAAHRREMAVGFVDSSERSIDSRRAVGAPDRDARLADELGDRFANRTR